MNPIWAGLVQNPKGGEELVGGGLDPLLVLIPVLINRFLVRLDFKRVNRSRNSLSLSFSDLLLHKLL